MALRGNPYLPLYVNDFLADEKLLHCSAAATGVYIRLLCLLHKEEDYGRMRLRPKYGEGLEGFAVMLSRMMPYEREEILPGLAELCEEGVITIEGGVLSQKRMVRDGQMSMARSEAGRQGGRPPLCAQCTSEECSEIEEKQNQKQTESKGESKQKAKVKANLKQNQKQTESKSETKQKANAGLVWFDNNTPNDTVSTMYTDGAECTSESINPAECTQKAECTSSECTHSAECTGGEAQSAQCASEQCTASEECTTPQDAHCENVHGEQCTSAAQCTPGGGLAEYSPRSPEHPPEYAEGRARAEPWRADFDAFWAAYPLKKGKARAEQAFRRLAPSQRMLGELIEALERQKRWPQWLRNGGEFIPYAATWLNGRRWEDEEAAELPRDGPTPSSLADRILKEVAGDGC